MKVRDIALSDIKVLENIRVREDTQLKELMQSIKQVGLKEPIGVGKTKDDNYVLMYGWRRFVAYKKLGYTTIPSVIEDEPDLATLLITNATENVQRRNITPYELGRICYRLSELGLSAGEIASRLGMDTQKIKMVQVLYEQIPENMRSKITFMAGSGANKKGKLPAGIAYRIYQMRRSYGFSQATYGSLLETTRKNELGVRDLEVIALLLDKGFSVPEALKSKDDYQILRIDAIVDKKELNKRVDARGKGKKYNLKELTRMVLCGELPPFTRKFMLKRKTDEDNQ